MPERSSKPLPLNEKMDVLDLIRKEKKCMFKLLRSVVRRSLLSETLSRKEICVNFSVSPQIASYSSGVWEVLGWDGRQMKFVGWEKWPDNVFQSTVVCSVWDHSLYEEFRKWSPKTGVNKPFIAWKCELQRFKNRFGLENIRVTGRAARQEGGKGFADMPGEEHPAKC